MSDVNGSTPPAELPSPQNPDDEGSPICRVCRSQGTPEDPLFFPCKCSGSMKYVHQSCLEDWLKVSGKETCEICNFPFQFSTVYSVETPDALPFSLLLGALIKRLKKRLWKYSRISLFLGTWLVLAPLGTYWLYQALLFTPFSSVIHQLLSAARGTVDLLMVQFPFFVAKLGLALGQSLYQQSLEPLLRNEFVHSFTSSRNSSFNFTALNGNFSSNLNASTTTAMNSTLSFTQSKIIAFTGLLFHSQMITMSVVSAAILLLGLRELIVAQTPEEEIQAYNEEQKRKKRLDALEKQRAEFLRAELKRMMKEQKEKSKKESHDLSQDGSDNEGPSSSSPQGRPSSLPKNGPSGSFSMPREPLLPSDMDRSFPPFESSLADEVEDYYRTKSEEARREFEKSSSFSEEGEAEMDLKYYSEIKANRTSLSRDQSTDEKKEQLLKLFQNFDERQKQQLPPSRQANQEGSPLKLEEDLRRRRTTTRSSRTLRSKIPVSSPSSSRLGHDPSASSPSSSPSKIPIRRSTTLAESTSNRKGKQRLIEETTNLESPSDMVGNPSSIRQRRTTIVHEWSYIQMDPLNPFSEYGLLKKGPVSDIELEDLVKSGEIPFSSYIKREDWALWKLFTKNQYELLTQHQDSDIEEWDRIYSNFLQTLEDDENGLELETITAIHLPPPENRAEPEEDEHLWEDEPDLYNQDENVDVSPVDQDPANIPVEVPAPVPDLPNNPNANNNNIDVDANQNNGNEDMEAMININIGPNMQIEIEANDDFNELLDMIGLFGPLSNLVKSLLLYYLFAGVVLFVGLSLPHTMGLLSMSVVRNLIWPGVKTGLASLHQVLEYVTDPLIEPLVDGLLVIGKLGFSFIVGGLENVLQSLGEMKDSHWMVETIKTWTTTLLANVMLWGGQNGTITETMPMNATNATAFLLNMTTSVLNETILNTTHMITTKIQPDSNEATQFIRMVLLGYSEFLMYAVYAFWSLDEENSHPYLRTFKKLCIKLVKSFFITLKLIFFVTIELGLFPIYCGILVDLCLLPVVGPGVSIAARLAFWDKHPSVASFLHWVMGTTFMFQYANYVSLVRSIVRPGVLWFLRDPNDPQFQPMTEIMTRPFVQQLRKLAIGVAMYTAIIVSTLGGCVAALMGLEAVLGNAQGTFKIFPLRWDYNDSISEFPIDLVLFHLAGPSIWKSLNPRRRFKTMVQNWFRWSGKRLRLTGFLFGGRIPEEETDLYTEKGPDGQPVQDSKLFRFMRVPNHDHIEIIPGVKDIMTRIRENDPVVGRANESEADTRANWTKVYVPRFFKARVIFLLVWNQVCFAGLVTSAVAIPLFVGRHATALIHERLAASMSIQLPSTFVAKKLMSGRTDLVCHDVYSYILGFVICALIFFPLSWLFNLIRFGYRGLKRRNAVRRRSLTQQGSQSSMDGEEEPENFPARSSLYTKLRLTLITWWLVTGRKALQKSIAFLNIFFWMGIVVPILLGAAFELYVLRAFGAPKHSVHLFFILNHWTFGILLLRLLLLAIQIGPETGLKRALSQLSQRGLLYSIKDFYKNIVVPLVIGSMLCMIAPKLIFLAGEKLRSQDDGQQITSYAQYLVLFSILASLIYSIVFKSIEKLVQNIKDEEFRIGRTLHNFNDTQHVEAIPDATTTNN